MSAMSITGPIAASAAVNDVEHLGLRPLGTPLGHDRLQFVAVCGPATRSRRTASSPDTPSTAITRCGHRLARRRQRHPAIVAAPVRAPRHGVRQPGTEPRLLLAASRRRARRAGPISWNIVSRRLTSTTCPTPECSATIVANAAARPVTSSVSAIGGSSGWPSGSPLSAARPDIASAIVAKPGRAGVRTVLPEPRDPGDHERGVAGEQHVRAEPEPLERARDASSRRSTSASSSRPSSTSRSASCFTSSTIVRLLRLTSFHHSPTPSRGSRQAMSRRLSPPGPLDLDHVGAEVGEVAGSVRPGEHGRHVDDPEPGERTDRVQSRRRHGCHDAMQFARPADVVAAAGVREAHVLVATLAGRSRHRPSRPHRVRAAIGAPARASRCRSRWSGGARGRRRRTRRRPARCR